MKKKTKTQLKKTLDKVFSQYVRWKSADHNGYVECFTCGALKLASGIGCIQAGHFISRKHMATRYGGTSGLNVMPQCQYCNVLCNGKQYEFGVNLDAAYGNGTASALLKESRTIKKFTHADYQEFIEKYTIKLKDLME